MMKGVVSPVRFRIRKTGATAVTSELSEVGGGETRWFS
jgi:hypothetical protein